MGTGLPSLPFLRCHQGNGAEASRARFLAEAVSKASNNMAYQVLKPVDPNNNRPSLRLFKSSEFAIFWFVSK